MENQQNNPQMQTNMPPMFPKKKKKLPFWLIIILVFAFVGVMGTILENVDSGSKDNTSESKTEKVEAKEVAKIDSATVARLQGHFKIDTDDFTETTWVKHKNNAPYRNQNAIYSYFQMKDGKPTNFRLVVQYEGEDWLFIYNTIVMSDEGKFEVPGIYERDNNSRVWEWTDAYVSPDDIKVLEWTISGNNPKMRHDGKQYHKDRRITQKEINNIKETIEYYRALGGE